LFGPLCVEHHDADVFAVDPVPGVGVANRRVTGRTAELGLLTHAFAGFLR